MSGIEKYVNYTPREVRAQMQVIGDETNLGILTYLLCEGTSDLMEMSDKLNLIESELNKRLKPLMQSALVESYFRKGKQVYGTTLSANQLMFGIVYSQDLTEEQINEGIKKIASGSKT